MTLGLRHRVTDECSSGLYSDLLQLNGKRRRIDSAVVLARDHEKSTFLARSPEKSSFSKSASESEPSTAEKSFCGDYKFEQL
jgi:hypothetical protein